MPNAPVKITFVVHQFPPKYFTGTESYAFALARALRAAGEDVDVYTLDPAFGEATGPWREFDEHVDGVPVRRVNFWMMLHRDWARLEYRHPLVDQSFRRHLEKRRPDLVHVFHLRYLGVGLIEQARALGIPLFVHLTDFWFLCPRVILVRGDGALCEGPPDGGAGCLPCAAPDLAREAEVAGVLPHARTLHRCAGQSSANAARWDLPARVLTWLDRPTQLRRALTHAHTIFAPSRFLRDRFVANGCGELPIEVAPYGVDRARLAGHQAARAARTGAASRLTFGFLGSIAPHKGVHTLLDAFLALRGDARLLVFGRTTDFADYAAPLLTRAASDPRVHFAGPFAFHELGSVLGQIDVLVAPSTWYENTPFVVLEAFAAGIAVVATDLGGLAEIVHDGVCGDLFPREDVAALRHKLQRLIDEPERLAAYRRALPQPRTLQDDAAALQARYATVAAAHIRH